MNSTDGVREEYEMLRRELILTQEKLKNSERKLEDIIAVQHSSINQNKPATSSHNALDYLSLRSCFQELKNKPGF
jgi:hypothetical protein